MLEKAEVVKESNKVIVRGIFQRADTPNKNERVYTRSLWESILKRPEVKGAISGRTMLGELDHPDVTETSLKNVSHLVTKLELTDKNEVIGEAEILDTPNGLILQKLIEAGVQVGISSRGYVIDDSKPQRTKTGHYQVPESFVLKTFDFVVDPSTPGAFPQVVSESIKAELLQLVESAGTTVNANIKAICESLNTDSGKGDEEDMERIQQLEAQLAQRDKTISELEGSYRSVYVENSNLKTQLEQGGSNDEVKAKLEGEVAQAKTLIEELSSKVQQGDKRNEAAVALIAEMKVQIEDANKVLEGTVAACDEKLQLSVEVIENLRDRYLTAEGMIKDLDEQVAKQAGDLDKLTVKVSKYESTEELEKFIKEKSASLNMSEEAVRNAIAGAKTIEEAKDQLLNVKAYIEKHQRTLPVGQKRVDEGAKGDNQTKKKSSKLANAIAGMR